MLLHLEVDFLFLPYFIYQELVTIYLPELPPRQCRSCCRGIPARGSEEGGKRSSVPLRLLLQISRVQCCGRFFFLPIYCVAVDRQLPERVFSCEKTEWKYVARFELVDLAFFIAEMEKISVTIRVRPLSKAEAAKGSPWKLGPNSIALCNASGSTISGQSYTFGMCSSPKITILFALFSLCFS